MLLIIKSNVQVKEFFITLSKVKKPRGFSARLFCVI
jgi:hypothetical protein